MVLREINSKLCCSLCLFHAFNRLHFEKLWLDLKVQEQPRLTVVNLNRNKFMCITVFRNITGIITAHLTCLANKPCEVSPIVIVFLSL